MGEIYHSGEREVQHLIGEENIANSNGRIISDKVIKGAVNFIEKQPMMIASSTNNQQKVWASLLIGDTGFIKVPTPETLLLDVNRINSHSRDVFFRNIDETSEIGTLFIELSTRRRFRINGVSSRNEGRIEVAINEAYANCPKYIQRRMISFPERKKEGASGEFRGEKLTSIEKDWISKADTFFVASRSAEGRMDASHRGGNPGFIEILNDHTLKIPDYQGNSMYNTLGNFVQNPNAGLLFVDFAKGHTLQLTGMAELHFNQNSEIDMQKTTGTGRYWLFRTDRWIRTENQHNANWELVDYSPFNPS